MKTRIRPDKLVSVLALLLICVGFILPFVWMLSTSLKTLDKTMALPPTFIPDPFVPQNYSEVIHHPKLDFPATGAQHHPRGGFDGAGHHDFQRDCGLWLRQNSL